MIWVTIAVMFCGGVLAASNLIIAKKPDAKELIDKLVPYQGWIGIVMFLWGIWDTIHVLTSGWFSIISIIPLTAIVILVAVLVEVVLGFLLGFGLISKYALSKNEQAMAKGKASEMLDDFLEARAFYRQALEIMQSPMDPSHRGARLFSWIEQQRYPVMAGYRRRFLRLSTATGGEGRGGQRNQEGDSAHPVLLSA